MIADLKPYQEYKDSGLPWLGQVPEHWDVQKPRHIGTLLKGVGGTKEDALSAGVPCVRYGELYTTHTFFVRKPKAFIHPDRVSNYTPLHYGDVLFAASGETLEEIGKSAVNLIEGTAVCGGDVIILRPTVPVHAPFLGYLMDCRPSANQKATMGRGTTVKHIYPDELKNLLFPFPPVLEQAAIVRFLDWANGRLERAIRAKRKVIALLGEQKQAIIHRAVTRGLDPSVPLKHSGIPWLGDIPQHWEVLPLKRIAWFRSGAGFPVEEQGRGALEIPFLKVSDMTKSGNERWIDSENNSVSRETARRLGAHVFPANSIIFPKVGGAMLTNKRRLLRRPSCIDNNVMGCVVDRGDLDFVFIMLEQLDLGLLSKPGPVPAIGEGEVREIRVAIPPVGEQQAVVRFIRKETRGLIAAISRLEREIDLLREYRTRLVADVVTGKLDVREAAARLPDEAPLDTVEDDADLDDELEAADEEASIA